MLVIIGIATTFVILLVTCLLFLPLTLTVFFVLTAGSFIAFQLSQNPASVSRLWAHVHQAAPEFWLQTREISVSGASSTRARPDGRGSSKSVPRSEIITDSFRTKGKENVAEYTRPILKPRRFVHSQSQARNEFQNRTPLGHGGNNLTSYSSDFQNLTPGNTRQSDDGNSFMPIINLDEKHSLSRLPLSPIFPENKSFNSPDIDLSSSMLRFNSGQDSMLHPSMHYPTHQPDLVTSPGLLPSVSWLKDGALASPRHRKGNPRLQSPVMVRIASPLPDRPASPLFRKLASEEKPQKSSSTDKVIMAIKQRQKRSVQDVATDIIEMVPASKGKESKRRKLDSSSGKTTPSRADVDMDLSHVPLVRGMRNVLSASSKYGITSPTPRNPIVSSFSSSKRPQGSLKRRKDTDSVEMEEDVSPIKKSMPPILSEKTSPSQSPRGKVTSRHPVSKVTGDASSTFSPLRSGGKPLYFEKNAEAGRDGKEADVTPRKSGLKKVVFTPQRTPLAQRVDTPGEYTAADKEEDRAQARKKVSYLMEMLTDEPSESPKDGATSETSAKPQNSLFSTAVMPATTPSSSLPALSVAPTKNTSVTAALSSHEMGALAKSNIVFSSLLAPGAGKNSDAATSQASSAATPAKTTELGGGTGFKMPTTPATSTSQTNLGASGLLSALASSQPKTALGGGLGASLGGGLGATQVDTKKQSSGTAASSAGPASQSTTPSVALSGGFPSAGQKLAFGMGSTTSTTAAPSATSANQLQPQSKPMFGASTGGSGSISSSQAPTQPTSTSSAQIPSGGFKFGQTAGTTPSKEGFAFGSAQVKATTASGLTSISSPFPGAVASSSTAPTQTKTTLAMPSVASTAGTASSGLQFTPVFGQPKTSQSTATSGQTPTFSPAFGAPSQVGSKGQSATGGFSFGATPTTSAPATTPGAFNFGGASATATKAPTSITSTFGSAGQTTPAFGASNSISTAGTSVFGTTPTAGTQGNKPATMFGSGTTQQTPSFGAPSSGSASVFDSSSAPSAQKSLFGNTTGASKPAFGTPSATVTPFGGPSGASQTPGQTATSFQFGGSKTQGAAPASQPPASGGFGFVSQKTTPSFNMGSATAAPSNGFQFGQTTPSKPAAGGSQPSGFFGAAPAASPAQFNATPSFGGSPAPAFGASPSPGPGAGPGAAAPGGGGFSIGAGGNNNNVTNQRRANRLRQVRNRAGRR